MKDRSPTVQQLLSQYLVDAGKLKQTEISRMQSLPESVASGLGTVLSNTGLISDHDLARAYSHILDLPLYSEEEDGNDLAGA